MQSKNALVNHYKSFSLMQGDDFQRISKVTNINPIKKEKDDFDDISSIYTAHKQSDLEKTLKKRVRDR